MRKRLRNLACLILLGLSNANASDYVKVGITKIPYASLEQNSFNRFNLNRGLLQGVQLQYGRGERIRAGIKGDILWKIQEIKGGYKEDINARFLGIIGVKLNRFVVNVGYGFQDNGNQVYSLGGDFQANNSGLGVNVEISKEILPYLCFSFRR